MKKYYLFLFLFLMSMSSYSQFKDLKSLYFFLAHKNISIEEGGFMKFWSDMQVEKNLKEVYDGLKGNPDIDHTDYNIFKYNILHSNEGWNFLLETNDYKTEWLLKKDRVIKEKEGFIVWVKWKYYDSDRESEADNRYSAAKKYEQEHPGKWLSYSHSIYTYCIDVQKYKYKIIGVTEYDEYGDVLNVTKYEDPDWDFVVPDSVMDDIFSKLKKYCSL